MTSETVLVKPEPRVNLYDVIILADERTNIVLRKYAAYAKCKLYRVHIVIERQIEPETCF